MLDCDAAVIGAGFFGCEIALALRGMGLERVVLIDRAAGILTRASYVNQARVHNGYHYPRSLTTGLSSRSSFARFCEDYGHAVHRGGVKLYAIARDSKTSPAQFERFCREIGAPYRPLGKARAAIFDTDLVSEAYEVEEVAFDASRLASGLQSRLASADIDVRLGTEARIRRTGPHGVDLDTSAGPLSAAYVFNCTYGELDRLGIPLKATVKRELAEVVLIEAGPRLPVGGITLMDGPYFSTMPFPARHCFSLTHVRYTPHAAWTELPDPVPQPARSNAIAMMRDAARYVPAMRQVRHVGSLFELKAVLRQTEASDARPILFEQNEENPRVISVLGAKLDNIYDVLALVRGQAWMQ